MLSEIHQLFQNCDRCELKNHRTRIVFGEGGHNAKLMLIGEGPGQDEDEQGRPFVGAAGQQLNKILEYVEIPREEIFVNNSCLCRPPNNRAPILEEIKACNPRLKLEISIIKPKLIVCLGKIAVTALFGEFKGPLKQFFDRDDLEITLNEYTSKVIVTYHPSALLRNTNFKRNSIPHWNKIKELYHNVNL